MRGSAYRHPVRSCRSRRVLITSSAKALHRGHSMRLVAPFHRIVRPAARIICIWRSWQATKVATTGHTSYQPVRLGVHLLGRLHPLLFLLEHHRRASLIAAIMVWMVHAGQKMAAFARTGALLMLLNIHPAVMCRIVLQSARLRNLERGRVILRVRASGASSRPTPAILRVLIMVQGRKRFCGP